MRTNRSFSDSSYDRARNKLKLVKDFYTHLAIYLIFVPFFILLNLKSGGFPWAIFPIAGWGFGVLAHAAETFSWNVFFGRDWEARKIREYIEKDDFDQFDNR